MITLIASSVRAFPKWSRFFLLFVLLLSLTAFSAPLPDDPFPRVPVSETPSNPDWAALRSQAHAEGQVRVIVEVDPGSGLDQPLRAPTELLRTSAIAQAQERLLASFTDHPPTAVTRFRQIPFLALSLDPAGLDALAASAEVRSVSLDHLNFPTLDSSGPLVGAPAAWQAGFSGAGQTVAILDTGVDKTHPFLAGKVVSEACFSGGGQYTFLSVCPGGVTASTAPGSAVPPSGIADFEHGTHVAGIAAGLDSPSDSPAYSGVARDSTIIAIQVFSYDPDPFFPETGAFDSDIIKGLERVYELRNTFDIAAVNLSLGGMDPYESYCDSEEPAFKSAVDLLRSANIATIVASGNLGWIDKLSSPACLSNVISVGSTTDADNVSSFTNTSSFLSLYAPGSSISSSLPGGSYGGMSGTSMAAPHVAGAWAVIKEKNPNAAVTQILNALRSTGIPIYDSGYTVPRIRINSALGVILDPYYAFIPLVNKR